VTDGGTHCRSGSAPKFVDQTIRFRNCRNIEERKKAGQKEGVSRRPKKRLRSEGNGTGTPMGKWEKAPCLKIDTIKSRKRAVELNTEENDSTPGELTKAPMCSN